MKLGTNIWSYITDKQVKEWWNIVKLWCKGSQNNQKSFLHKYTNMDNQFINKETKHHHWLANCKTTQLLIGWSS